MNKETKLLNIGVLGCGQISQAAHFDSIKRSRNANLYAICDVDEYLLQRMNAIYEPDKVYTDYEQMLADPNVDAVVIGIADQFHVEAVKQAVRAGKHVLVEKPLGVSIEEAEELKELVDRTDLRVQVGNMKRFDPGIVAAKEFVDHEMGEIIGLKAWYCDSTYRYTVTENVQPVIISGNKMKRPAGDPKANKERYYMLGHGSHLLDTARYLGGNIVSVKAWNTQKFGAYCWFITAEFESGFVAQLDLTIAVRMDWHEGFQIYGEFGSVMGKTYNPWTLKSSDVEIFKASDNSYHRLLGADGHFYRLQIEGFADSVLHHKPGVGATIEDGLATLRAMLAVEESVKTGNTIYLSDVSGYL